MQTRTANFSALVNPGEGFVLSLSHGVCVGIPIEPSAVEEISAAERAFVADRGGHRRQTWASGRAAMRRALALIDEPVADVLADELGAPNLPSHLSGSISHSSELAVALVGRAADGAVGIDLESLRPRRMDVSTRILTPRERLALAHLAAPERSRAVITRFSIKEAIYKAVAPTERRYVGFHEVELVQAKDGTFAVETGLPYRFEVEFAHHTALVLATARALPL